MEPICENCGKRAVGFIKRLGYGSDNLDTIWYPKDFNIFYTPRMRPDWREVYIFVCQKCVPKYNISRILSGYIPIKDKMYQTDEYDFSFEKR